MLAVVLAPTFHTIVPQRLSSLISGPRACPYCLSKDTKDSIWRNREEKAGRFWLRPVRCRACHKRFVRLRRVPVAVLGGLVLLTVVGTLAWTLSGIEAQAVSDHDRMLSELAPLEAERRRAAAGDAAAQYTYGMLLFQGGSGEASDMAEAVRWLEKAAAQGHAQAQYELALAFKLGRGTLQDYPAAARWFARAARSGHVAAQYHMGRLHRIGEGVSLDLVRAYAWFNRAAAQGHGAARGARDEVGASLRPEQLQFAQRLSREAEMPEPDAELPTLMPTASGVSTVVPASGEMQRPAIR